MTFTQETLPPIFQYIIQKIDDNQGKITTDEFKKILYSLRIEKNGIKDIKKWLSKQGYIVINREFHKETIQLIKPPL